MSLMVKFESVHECPIWVRADAVVAVMEQVAGGPSAGETLLFMGAGDDDIIYVRGTPLDALTKLGYDHGGGSS